ncbi:MAG: hypothetical protein KGS45_12955 [Planctomycetes bacterium]|nr:hypothetical protein [Planctomycetota bacterium]
MSHAEKWSVLEDAVGPVMSAAISGCMAQGYVLSRRTLRRQPGDAPGPVREVVHMRRERDHFRENVLFIDQGDDWRYLTSFPSAAMGSEIDLHIGELSPARNRAEAIVRAALPCGTAVEFFASDYIASCRKYLAADTARVRLHSLGLSLMPAERRVIGIARPVVEDVSSPLFRGASTRLRALPPKAKLGLELDLTHLAAFDSRPDAPDVWRFHTDVVSVRSFEFLGAEFLELHLDWTRCEGRRLTLPLCISAATLGTWRPQPGQAVSGEIWVHADLVS